MTPFVSKLALIGVWLLAVTTALSVAVMTISIAAWFAVAMIVVMPPLMLILMAQKPQKPIGQIIREAEAERMR